MAELVIPAIGVRRLLLVRPNQRYFVDTMGFNLVLQQLGVLIGQLLLAASERQRTPAVTVDIMNCLGDPHTILTRDESTVFHGFSSEIIKARVKTFDLDHISVSVNFTSQATLALEIIQTIYQSFLHLSIVAGGYHATVCVDEIMQSYKEVSWIILGEGEDALSMLIEHLNGSRTIDFVPNVARRVESSVVHASLFFIADLDFLFVPAYDLVDMELYFYRRSLLMSHWDVVSLKPLPRRLAKRFLFADRYRGIRDIAVHTSRGCPSQCVFCLVHCQFGHKWYARSAQYVVEHLRLLMQDFGATCVHFEDDSIFTSPTRFVELLDHMLEQKLISQWDLLNGIRSDTLNVGLIEKMMIFVCQEIVSGIESGSHNVLDTVIYKPLDLKRAEETLRLCANTQVPLGASFIIIGVPGETIAGMQENVMFAHKLEWQYIVDVRLGVATPYPGTEVFNICAQKAYFARPPGPTYARISQGLFFYDRHFAFHRERQTQRALQVLPPRLTAHTLAIQIRKLLARRLRRRHHGKNIQYSECTSHL